MTQDEIIDMAEQAHLTVTYIGEPIGLSYAQIAHFAKLVAAKEREACAKIVEESSLPDTYSEPCLLDIANEIRARGDEA